MSRINAGRILAKWLRIICGIALFASLFTVAMQGTSAAQTCNASGPSDLQISAPTAGTSPPVSSFEYQDPSGVGTTDFVYVTVTDVCGTLPADINDTLNNYYPNDFTVTFPSDTPVVADMLDDPITSASFDPIALISPGTTPGDFTQCQYNPAGLFGSTNSVTCNVPPMYNGWTMTLGFFVQLPVNNYENSVTFTASLDANNDMPGFIGSPQSWTTQISHPDLTAQFEDPNNPPAAIYIGTGFNYNVTFENVGPAATPGPVSAVIQLPVAGLSSASVNSTTSGTCTYNHPTFFDETRSVTCTFGPMPSDSQVVVSIGATSSTSTGYYTATATIDPNDVTGSEDPNNAASITTYVTDLSAPPPIYTPIAGTPIPVGEVAALPQAVGVDPVTGTVFAANVQTGSVVAISEASQSVVAGISVGGTGYNPVALAVDPVSGTVYVTELSPPQVAVITEDPSDPADDQMTATVTVPPGTQGFDGPDGIAVLPGTTPGTGTVYVANGAGDTVSVISEATDTVTSVIPIPAQGGASDSYPAGVAVDPVTGLVYVADQGDGYVSVISGSTLVGSIGVGGQLNDPTGIAVDPDTGTVYVTVPAPLPGGTAAEVYVIQEDPASPADATVATAIPVPPYGDGGATYGVPESIAVNPGTASVYVSNFEGSLDVINEDTADPAADAFNLAEDTGLVPTTDPDYPDFDEVYGVAVDTSAGNSYSGTVYVVSDQTEDMYPVTFPPGQQPQSISFTAPATGTVGGSATLTATGGGSGYPVTFTVDGSSGAGVCTVSVDTVSYTGAGSCVIDANQAGNISYAVAPQVTQTITITPGDQSISFTAPSTGVVGGSSTLTATGGGSGNPVTFSVDPSSGPGVCSVSGDTVSYAAVGDCVIDANQAGNADYTAATQVSQVIPVTGIPQSISFEAPATGAVGASATLTASGGASGNPVLFSVDPSSGSGVCSVSGDTVSYTAAGSCVVDANQVGNSEYAAAAEVIQAIYVMGIPQSISFNAPATGTVGGSATLTATGGESGNPVVFSVDPSSGVGVCSVSGANGAVVSYLAAGGCVIDANQVGNATYTQAPQVTQTITVNSVVQSQSISFTAPAAGTVGGSTTLTATGGASGNPVLFSVDPSSGSGVCSVSGDTVSYTAAGSCVIDANQAGDSDYAAAQQVTQTITVDAQLAVTTSSLPDGSAGVGFDQTLTASGGITPYFWSVASGSLPPGLTLSGGGEISGTPASGGSFSFIAAVTDSEMPAATATQALTITVNAAPAITTGASATFTAGTTGSFTVTTVGYPAATLTEAGALPSGVTFGSDGNGTATLAGIPAAGSEGTYMVTISASNSGGSVAQAFVLTVNGGLDITSARSATATAGTAFSFTVTASGTPAATLTHTGALPSGVTFTADSDGTATLTGTPAATAHGVYPITIIAKNSTGATSQAFLLTVDAAPNFNSSAAVTEAAGTAFSYAVATTAYPAAKLTSGTLPAGVAFADNGNGTGTLSGNSALAAGTYAVTITAANATSTVSQTITLTVKAAGTTEQVPSFTSPLTAMATAGTALSFTVTTAGSPTGYTSNVTHSGTLPAGVSFTNNGNGTATFSGTPSAAADGSYLMTLTAKDAAGTTTQSFVLTVTGAPAITTAATATATVGSGFSNSVIATGSPTPAITESGALPQGLTWVSNGNGMATLAGTPTVNQGGVYTLTLTATNSLGSLEQTFTLTVDQAPAITSAASASATHGTPFTFTVTTTGYPLATITRTGTVPGLTFTSTGKGTATLAGIPTKAGTYTFTITAKNSAGSATQTFTLVVN